MSTRSGKRIHSSFHETTLVQEIDHVAQSERKTRSRRFKENVEELSVSVVKTKKRANYVSYPTEDEVGTNSVDIKDEVKPARSLLKNALREQNVLAASTESADGPNDVPVRTTRRTRKFTEDTKDAQENHNHVQEVGDKTKKEKKKKKSITDETLDGVSKKKSKKKGKKAKTSGTMVVEDIVPENAEKYTLNRSNMSVESFHSAAGSPLKNTDIIATSDVTSPKKDFKVETPEKPERRQTRSVARISSISIPQSTVEKVVKPSLKRKSSFKNLDSTFETDKILQPEELDTTLTNIPKKRKSSIRDTVSKKNADTTFDKEIKDSTYDLEDLERRKSVVQTVINTTYDKSDTPKSVTNTTLNENEDIQGNNTNYENKLTFTSKTWTPQLNLNSMLEKSNCKSSDELVTNCVNKKPAINTTFEKDDPIINSISRKSAIINTTYEKDSTDDTKQDLIARKSIVLNDTFEKNDTSSYIPPEAEDSNTNQRKSSQESQKLSTEMNSTYDKTEMADSTFEKQKIVTLNKEIKLDTTFEKNSKSSIISSDASNITLDKSDVSRISITSDDSKDNIINTTPVLIESSMDESQTNASRLSSKIDDQLETPTKIVETNSEICPKTPITPLIREGTFTKDDSDVNGTELDLLRTPTRKMSLPSAGCTPFTNKSGSSKSMMNITQSLEKSRRSSLAEPLPRATRVMFCSPVNNPVVVAQQKRKVIKSNLKGSNKSFVFEDAPAVRAAPRKRSFTASDALEARSKRARPRTASATAKLPDPGTPSKKPSVTPHKSEAKVSRTRLPNFAALHQREFAKMESLDECQERRARRARQLLTPTGPALERPSPALERPGPALERPSPAESIETKAHEAKKSLNQQSDSKEQSSSKRPKPSKKPDTPIKSLPTLKSLNPGYTRFGFKLNYDVNPFSVTNKNDKNINQSFSSKKNTVKRDLTRPLKEIRGLKRQTTLPSLTGTMSAREAAKQTIMREKSFTDKRNKTRTENRTVIKGVRTNRRFELQMRMRNLE